MPCDSGLSGESSLAEAGQGFGEYSSNEGDFFSEDAPRPIIWETKISGLSTGRQNPGTGRALSSETVRAQQRGKQGVNFTLDQLGPAVTINLF